MTLSFNYKTMKKIFTYFLCLFLFISSSYATKPYSSTSQVCNITWKIEKVEFKEAYRDDCFDSETFSCPVWAYRLESPDLYEIWFRVESVKYVSWWGDWPTCEEQFKTNKYNDLYIEKANLENISDLIPWNTISWNVKWDFWNKIISYDLISKNYYYQYKASLNSISNYSMSDLNIVLRLDFFWVFLVKLWKENYFEKYW